jgi:nitrite reductase/ring-hydroxylating ferredoxin subunit
MRRVASVAIGNGNGMSDDGYCYAAKCAEIPRGGKYGVVVGGVRVLICHADSENRYYAVENRCSHAYSSFDEGRLRGHRLMCPLHGACFDIRDGSVLGRPAFEPIRCFPVRVCGEHIEVRVDAQAGDASAPA